MINHTLAVSLTSASFCAVAQPLNRMPELQLAMDKLLDTSDFLVGATVLAFTGELSGSWLPLLAFGGFLEAASSLSVLSFSSLRR